MTEQLSPPTAPYNVAAELLDEHQAAGVRTLWHHRGQWMRWESSYWAEVESAELRAQVYKRLEGAIYVDGKGDAKPWQPTKVKVTDILDALAAHTHMPESVDPPTWLVRHTIPPAEVVACANGLLHVGTRQIGALTPHFYNRVAVPFDYQHDAPRPARWLEFLNELWPGDPDSINALQEWFGYVLSGRTDLQKIMLLVGPTRSGKGTIARVLSELVGRGNAAGPTLAGIGANFGLSPLLGKPLAVVSDARLGGTNVHQVVERLLSISGEDMLTVDRKYREPWTGKLPTRLLVLSNELPRFGDASGAIAHRFIVLTMQASFLGREDPGLTPALLAELPGILSWSLDGLDRLTKAGRFTIPQSSSDATAAFQDLVSPVSAFVRDSCIVGSAEEVPATELFAAWKEWCEDNGHRAGSVQSLGRDLRATAPSLRATQRREGGIRARWYLGIALRHAMSRDVSRDADAGSGDKPAGQRGVSRTVTHVTRDSEKLAMEDRNRAHRAHRDNNGDSRVTSRDTGEPNIGSMPLDCPHGVPDGHLPYPSRPGAARCPQCREGGTK